MRVNQNIEIKPGDVRCPRCYAKDIVPSMPRGVLDSIMQGFHRIPRHCRACEKRFYIKQVDEEQADE